ncbi:HlyD family secretion protein [Alicyclobacillus vulcanalis]|uniref:HlyD family secretion protein n=1 Tax=Alicyclobacillus vulcanalis TaxID=252246 RepID=A0A1N7PGI2_9BACL|nr:HlyD family secretion protein [Alicyclobacillus vulcanalis]
MGIVPGSERPRVVWGRGKRRRLIWAGAAVVVVLGVGIPVGISALRGGQTVYASSEYTVGYRNITQTISTTGTVASPSTLSLNFLQSNAPVSDIYVKVGQKVQAGQMLARLDDSAQQIALQQARAQVMEAKASLMSAEAKLQQDESGATPQTLALDKNAIADDETAVQQAKQAYQLAVQAYNDRSSQEQAVQTAELNLTEAKQQLNAASDAVQLDEQQIAADQAAIKNAEQQLQTDQQSASNSETLAQQALQSDEQTLQADQQQLSEDEQQLQKDENNLQMVEQENPNVTQQQVEQAYEQYQQELSFYNSWAQGGYAGTNPYTTAVNNAEQIYNNLNDAYQAIQNAQNAVTQDQAKVNQDQNAIQQVQIAISKDQAEIQQAQLSGQQTVAKDQETIQSDEQQLQNEEIVLENDEAQAKLNQQKAEDTVLQDEQALQAAEQAYNDRTSAEQTLQQAKDNVTQAEEQLRTAELQLQNDETPASSSTIASDEAAVTNAQGQLVTAEANLESAEQADAETILRAPISGVITAVNGQVGELPNQGGSSASSSGGSSGTGFIQLEDLNPTDLQVDLEVDESQIGQVKVGDPVTFTVDAYPNETFSGTIVQIYPTPTTTSDVTQYEVVASVNNASGKLKPGMTASATVVTSTLTHVLAVPAIALHQIGSIEGVFVVGTRPKSEHFSFTNETGTNPPLGNGSAHSFASASARGSSGNQTGTFASRGTAGAFHASLAPKGTYFQPVQVGVIGQNEVQILSGLAPGEKILLTLPESTASTIVQSESSATPFRFGGGFARGGGQG